MKRKRFYSKLLGQHSPEWNEEVYRRAEEFSRICFENGGNSYVFVEVYDRKVNDWIPVHAYQGGKSVPMTCATMRELY